MVRFLEVLASLTFAYLTMMYELQKKARFHSSEPCSKCGNFTLIRIRIGTRCDTCGDEQDAGTMAALSSGLSGAGYLS